MKVASYYTAFNRHMRQGQKCQAFCPAFLSPDTKRLVFLSTGTKRLRAKNFKIMANTSSIMYYRFWKAYKLGTKKLAFLSSGTKRRRAKRLKNYTFLWLTQVASYFTGFKRHIYKLGLKGWPFCPQGHKGWGTKKPRAIRLKKYTLLWLTQVASYVTGSRD